MVQIKCFVADDVVGNVFNELRGLYLKGIKEIQHELKRREQATGVRYESNLDVIESNTSIFFYFGECVDHVNKVNRNSVNMALEYKER